MKKVLMILALLFTAGTLSAKDKADTSALWDEANTKYINGDYAGAIVLYDSIINYGYAGAKVYYNLGNAHFKDNSIGKAIVNYNRALRLSPYDKDIQYNLTVANSYIKDKIDNVPDFFLNNWFRGLRRSFSSNTWAVLSLILLAAALACALVYFLASGKGARKAGFFTGIALAVFFVISVSFSAVERKRALNASEAIVITSAVSVKSSPDRNSQDLFIIHEGTKVEVVSAFNGWTEIMIADGNKGWMLTEAIEMID